MKLPEGERFFSLEDSEQLKGYFLRALETFKEYKYIMLPTIEAYEELRDTNSYTIGKCTEETILTLRRDFTLSIARFFASYRNLELPCKVFYMGNVFSPTEGETYQIGLEVLGYSSIESDAKVIIDLWEYLTSCGVEGITVSIGHAKVVKKLLDGGKNSETLFKAFLEKDFYTLREFPQLCYLLKTQGREEFLKECLSLYPQIEQELSQLLELTKYLEGINYIIDLSEVRVQDYYTGTVFEFFVRDYGYAIAGGGRYNELYKSFGLDIHAVGGAVYINRLLEI